MFAEEKLAELLSVSSVTDQLGTFTIDAVEYPMIENGTVMPASWGDQDSTINFYEQTQINGGIEYGDFSYAINCRASSMTKSKNLAIAAFSALNRASRSGYGITCELLPTVPPADETDNYNTIIQARIRTNGSID